MARISKIHDFNENRRIQSLLESYVDLNKNGKVYSFENEDGADILVTPTDLRGALIDIIDRELEKYPEIKSIEIRKNIEKKLIVKLDEMEKKLFDFMNDKINNITQEIVSKTNKRLIEAEVNKQLDERIEKIKKLL